MAWLDSRSIKRLGRKSNWNCVTRQSFSGSSPSLDLGMATTRYLRLLALGRRTFSTSSILGKSKPPRPEPMGEFIAHFPQREETLIMKESKEEYVGRWKTYVHDLAHSAVPRRFGGPSFGSRVRDERHSSLKPRPNVSRLSPMAVKASVPPRKRGDVKRNK